MDCGYGTTDYLLDAVFGASYMQALHENLRFQHGSIRSTIVGKYYLALFNASLKPVA
jgi:hypothetical protein